jgi:hypothetical protein
VSRLVLLGVTVAGAVWYLALPAGPTVRMLGLVVFLLGAVALVIAGGIGRPPEYPTSRAYYAGAYPPLPDRQWVTVSARPEGLVVQVDRRAGRRILKYGRIEHATVTSGGPDGRWRAMSAYYRDLITQRAYPISFAPREPLIADALVRAVERRHYLEADLPWSVWRTHVMDVQVTDEELRGGATKTVSVERKVACAHCAGIEAVAPTCRECGGKGVRLEQDIVTVRIPGKSLPGHELTIPEMGHEDINGYRGPLVVRLTLPDASDAPRS